MPVSDIGAIYTPSIYGRTSFPLLHQGDPVFKKTFDGASDEFVGVSSDKIFVANHFFKTGEKLQYSPGTGTSIGITTTSPGNIGFSSYLPGEVYPIVVDKDNIRIALASSLALSNDYVGISTLGFGTVHTLIAEKQNAKCLIAIDNIIQSPISVGGTVGIITFTNTSFTLDTLQGVDLGTVLRVYKGDENEIVKVAAINYTNKEVSVSRGVGVLGTPQIVFTGIITDTAAEILSGGYNIVEDKIYFTDAPLEGTKINLTIPTSEINFPNSSFTYFTGADETNIITGSQCVFYSENPPIQLINGNVYYLIRSANNTFQFAETLFDAFNDNFIQFTTDTGNEFPPGSFQLFLVLPTDNSSFDGRVFLRSNYDGNYVFDDISPQFTGITSEFELTVAGVSTIGISSDNGIVLINNTFQYPESEEAFEYNEVGIGSTGQTFIEFQGSTDTKTYDVNVGGLPRGGIIVSYGVTSGSLYVPQKPANGVVVVSAAGTVSDILIGSPGAGYRTGITSYFVDIYNAEVAGSGAIAIAYPSATTGIITGVDVLNGGSDFLYNGASSTTDTTLNLLDPDGTPIGVAVTSIFETFRGQTVGTNNPGYVLIGSEIIKYTGIDAVAETLTGTVRGQLNTVGALHNSGSTITKYEYHYIAKFDDPAPYDDIPLTGSAAGIGASVSLFVNEFGEIGDIKFTNRGYNYKTGEVLSPSGVLGLSTQTSADELKITINEVAKDDFSAWNIGKLRKLEDLTSKVNGKRTIFTLLEKAIVNGSQVIRRTSLESDLAAGIDLSQNLLVFVNDILQRPDDSYVFLGGSQLEFTEAPPLGSEIKVYFYEGFDGDAEFFQNQTDVEEGDLLILQKDIFGSEPIAQKQRTIQRIESSDTVRTEVYYDRGLSESSSQRRAVQWTKQKSDSIVNGEFISKVRDKLKSGIGSITVLSFDFDVNPGIQTIGITTTDGTFNGFATSIIGINTTAGIGSFVQVGDYVESQYTIDGTKVVSIGASTINIGTLSSGISTIFGPNAYLGITSYSTSPVGINTIPLTFYRFN